MGDWLEVNADLVNQTVTFTVWPHDNSAPSSAAGYSAGGASALRLLSLSRRCWRTLAGVSTACRATPVAFSQWSSSTWGSLSSSGPEIA